MQLVSQDPCSYCKEGCNPKIQRIGAAYIGKKKEQKGTENRCRGIEVGGEYHRHFFGKDVSQNTPTYCTKASGEHNTYRNDAITQGFLAAHGCEETQAYGIEEHNMGRKRINLTILCNQEHQKPCNKGDHYIYAVLIYSYRNSTYKNIPYHSSCTTDSYCKYYYTKKIHFLAYCLCRPAECKDKGSEYIKQKENAVTHINYRIIPNPYSRHGHKEYMKGQIHLT